MTPPLARLILPNTDQSQVIDTAAVFVTADLQRAVEFYTQALGFSCNIDWSTKPTFAICQCAGAAIMLKLADTPSQPNRHLTPGLDLFDAYFWVRDIDAVYAGLKARGAPIAAGPVKRIHGCTEVMVEDPDGRLICFGYCP